MASPPPSPDVGRIARDIRAGDRTVLSRAITLIESKRADHRRAAAALTQELLQSTGKAVRVGITGVPGVGKSTTIDALGSMLTREGHKIAVGGGVREDWGGRGRSGGGREGMEGGGGVGGRDGREGGVYERRWRGDMGLGGWV